MVYASITRDLLPPTFSSPHCTKVERSAVLFLKNHPSRMSRANFAMFYGRGEFDDHLGTPCHAAWKRPSQGGRNQDLMADKYPLDYAYGSRDEDDALNVEMQERVLDFGLWLARDSMFAPMFLDVCKDREFIRNNGVIRSMHCHPVLFHNVSILLRWCTENRKGCDAWCFLTKERGIDPHLAIPMAECMFPAKTYYIKSGEFSGNLTHSAYGHSVVSTSDFLAMTSFLTGIVFVGEPDVTACSKYNRNTCGASKLWRPGWDGCTLIQNFWTNPTFIRKVHEVCSETLKMQPPPEVVNPFAKPPPVFDAGCVYAHQMDKGGWGVLDAMMKTKAKALEKKYQDNKE